MFDLKILVAVGLGGSCGALARYLAAVVVASRGGAPIWATLAVNILGCLLIGMAASAAANGNLSPIAKAALVSGFLGSLTTFSTYSLETLAFVREDRVLPALAYALGSLVLGVVAAAVGWLVIQRG